MPYLNFNSASPSLKLVITLMSVITIGIIVWFLGFLLSRIFFCLDVPAANDILYGKSDTLSIAQIKYYQMVQVVGYFIIPGFFLQWLFSTPEKSYFILTKKPQISGLLIVFVLLIISIPFINFLVNYNKSLEFPGFLNGLENNLRSLEDSAESLTHQLLSANNFGAYLINILIIAILPAIGEELIFRGVIQKIFYNISRNAHLAVIISAVLFSAVHGQFFGFIPRLMLGMFFGYLMIWSKNIWVPIIAHLFNNAIAVTAYYLFNNNVIQISPDNFGANILGKFGVAVSLLLFMAGTYTIYNLYKRVSNQD